MFEAHLYEAKSLRIVLAAFEPVCGSSTEVLVRVKCCDKGIFWQAINEELGSCVEFGFEAASFELFKCSKEISFAIKYMQQLLSQIQKGNNDDKVIFKLLDDDDNNGRGNRLLIVELQTPSGISRKIRLEITSNGDKVTFVSRMETRIFKSCGFSMQSSELLKLVEKHGIRFGFKCAEADVFFTKDGERLVKVNTCAAVEYPPNCKTKAVKSGAYHRRNIDMMAKVSTMCTAVNFNAEMNGTCLGADCKLQEGFVTGYFCINCFVRVID